MEEIVSTQGIVDPSSLITLELFDQVIIPTELAINSGDLISIAIREADIPLRPPELVDETSYVNSQAIETSAPRNPSLKCKHCMFTTSYKEYLTRHMRSHNAKQFSCKVCEYKTNSESGFRNHKISHETKMKSCRHKYCTAKCKVVPGKRKFESVIKRLFNCKSCNFVTEDHELLVEHTKQHCYDLQVNIESEFCVLCGVHIVKGFMDEHVKMHAG